MKKKIAEEWVKALRSGKYLQGDSMLQPTGQSFCCLGVLCDIAAREAVPVRRGVNGLISGQTLDCQQRVLNWSGLKEGNPKLEGLVTEAGEVSLLTQLNDGNAGSKTFTPFSFEQIADIIENRWEEL